MKKLFRNIAFVILSVTLLTSCSEEEEFVYPDIINEFVDLTTDSAGTVNLLTTDSGESWKVPPMKGLSGLSADTIYRAVSKFVPGTIPNEDTATLYTCEGVLAPVPMKASDFKEIKIDPVKIQSIWRAGEYVNIILNVLVKDKSHNYSFIENSLSNIDDSDKKRLTITLYHDNNNDVLAFYRTVYLSIPLWAYKNILNKGDEIEVNINTYDNGIVKSIFYY